LLIVPPWVEIDCGKSLSTPLYYLSTILFFLFRKGMFFVSIRLNGRQNTRGEES
jgi:hypothetical protein